MSASAVRIGEAGRRDYVRSLGYKCLGAPEAESPRERPIGTHMRRRTQPHTHANLGVDGGDAHVTGDTRTEGWL